VAIGTGKAQHEVATHNPVDRDRPAHVQPDNPIRSLSKGFAPPEIVPFADPAWHLTDPLEIKTAELKFPLATRAAFVCDGFEVVDGNSQALAKPYSERRLATAGAADDANSARVRFGHSADKLSPRMRKDQGHGWSGSRLCCGRPKRVKSQALLRRPTSYGGALATVCASHLTAARHVRWSTISAYLGSHSHFVKAAPDDNRTGFINVAFAPPNTQQVITFGDQQLELSVGLSQKLISRRTCRAFCGRMELHQILSWRLHNPSYRVPVGPQPVWAVAHVPRLWMANNHVHAWATAWTGQLVCGVWLNARFLPEMQRQHFDAHLDFLGVAVTNPDEYMRGWIGPKYPLDDVLGHPPLAKRHGFCCVALDPGHVDMVHVEGDNRHVDGYGRTQEGSPLRLEREAVCYRRHASRAVCSIEARLIACLQCQVGDSGCAKQWQDASTERAVLGLLVFLAQDYDPTTGNRFLQSVCGLAGLIPLPSAGRALEA